jgi:hypothetical protein
MAGNCVEIVQQQRPFPHPGAQEPARQLGLPSFAREKPEEAIRDRFLREQMHPDAVSRQMEVEDLGYRPKRFDSIEGNVLAVLGAKIPPIARLLHFIRNKLSRKKQIVRKG